MKHSFFSRIQNFIQEHLTLERGLSTNTIHSYRDTIKLLLRFLGKSLNKKTERISMDDLNLKNVLAFFDDLEAGRKNSIRTRNHRLAVIKAFCSYLLMHEPGHASQLEKIILIKMKKMPQKGVSYLSEVEVESFLRSFDLSKHQGIRDYALFLFLYNTGARAAEACGLRISDIEFEKPYKVTLKGKGKKTRQIPLWPQTIEALLKYFKLYSTRDDIDYVFLGKRLAPLSRFGLLYLVKSWATKASKRCKSLEKKSIGPHTIRHTTAMHLLQSGVDITVIKTWLGHVDLNTTHGYMEIDLKMKQNALAKTKLPLHRRQVDEMLNSRKDILAWLESL